MNIASLLGLLQAAAALLTLAKSPKATAAFMQKAVISGSNTVQVVTEASAQIGFAVPQNNGVAPNIADLLRAPYITAPGHWAPLGNAVSLIEEDTSFGDINSDGVDDAAVIVDRPSSSGTPNYFLAAMLNENGIMFNIADFPLGTSLNVTSHSITGENILLNGQSYTLLGNAIETN